MGPFSVKGLNCKVFVSKALPVNLSSFRSQILELRQVTIIIFMIRHYFISNGRWGKKFLTIFYPDFVII